MSTTTHNQQQHRRRHSRSSSGGHRLSPAIDTNAHVYVEVFFLDNSASSYHVPILIKENELTALICTKLGFTRPSRDGYYFGLVESTNGLTLDRPLAKTEEVGVLAWQWHQEEAPSKLVFACTLHFDYVMRSPCKVVLHYLYIQAVHHMVTGLYPVTPLVAVRLACLQFRVKFGVCGNNIRPDEFLGNRVVEFFPQPLLRVRKPSEWSKAMQTLFEEDNALSTMGEDAARQEYLRIIQNHPFYGSTLFRVVRDPQTSTARDALLAVNKTGIEIFPMPPSPLLEGAPDGDATKNDLDASVKHAVAGRELAFTLTEMLRWGYVPNTLFYVTVKKTTDVEEEEEGEAKGKQQQECVNFGTPTGAFICDNVTLYAYGYLTEQGHVEEEEEEEAAQKQQQQQAQEEKQP